MANTTATRTSLTTKINDNTSQDVTPLDVRDVFVSTLDVIDDYAKGEIAGEFTAPGNRAYVLQLSAPYTYTITSLVTQTTAGTATVTVAINGTTVTGLGSIAVGTTLTTSTATALNAVAAGAKVTLTFSNVTGTSEFCYSLRYTRT
jgi:hypothetical protein